MTFDVQIFDANGNHIAEYPNATTEDVLKFIRKGMIVQNQISGEVLTESAVMDMVGMSDGTIIMG